MEIKQINLSDVKEINEIRNYYILNTNYIFRKSAKSFDDDYAFFEEIINKEYPAVVALENGEILGFAYLYPFRSLDGYDKTMELSIYVKPNLSKKGIGSDLLNQIFKKSNDKYHVIISVITSSNENSIKFHKKHGFYTTGELKEVGFLNNEFLDVTFMQKIIN